MAAIAAAAIGAGGAIAGGSASKKGAQSAANTQSAAASRAADLSMQQYQQTRADLTPYRMIGANASDLLSQILGLPSSATMPAPAAPAPIPVPTNIFGGTPPNALAAGVPNGWAFIPQNNTTGVANPSPGGFFDAAGNMMAQVPGDIQDANSAVNYLQSQGLLPGSGRSGAPAAQPMSTSDAMKAALGRYGLKSLTFQPTQAELAATPGYQFDLSQGLLGVAGSNAAKGKGISGDALKGAAAFATGLANNTLTTQQGIFQQNLANVINPLEWAANLGQTAATQTGQLGLQGVSNVNAANIGGANALAAGQVGGANALANAFGGVGNAATNYLLFNNLMSGGGGGGYQDTGNFTI